VLVGALKTSLPLLEDMLGAGKTNQHGGDEPLTANRSKRIPTPLD